MRKRCSFVKKDGGGISPNHPPQARLGSRFSQKLWLRFDILQFSRYTSFSYDALLCYGENADLSSQLNHQKKRWGKGLKHAVRRSIFSARDASWNFHIIEITVCSLFYSPLFEVHGQRVDNFLLSKVEMTRNDLLYLTIHFEEISCENLF